MKKEIFIIGLGKMGSGIALNLLDHGYKVFGYNRTPTKTKELESFGLHGIYSFEEVQVKLSKPRIVWVMVPSGEPIEEIITGRNSIINFLEPGDFLIDAGNSFYKNTIKRYDYVTKKGVNFVDVGVSGGPHGARNGACLMIGGSEENFKKLENLFQDLSIEKGYAFFEGNGAGHFVKMVHNAIEYGMMQAIAEGFTLLRESNFDLDLYRVAEVYSHGSVIESSLIKWLRDGYKKYGQDLNNVSGTVNHSGEAEWAISVAKEMNVNFDNIEQALNFRKESAIKPSYTGKILSMLRNMFGGHSIK
ncbi:MAG: 6-phosphogluconate dehydrogenase [Candidatus Dojkabacteria bacterium]|nr:MAG: 6-phosphogluconate dehydrogenase [Candidatus Dojkabacteria bacterium]